MVLDVRGNLNGLPVAPQRRVPQANTTTRFNAYNRPKIHVDRMYYDVEALWNSDRWKWISASLSTSSGRSGCQDAFLACIIHILGNFSEIIAEFHRKYEVNASAVIPGALLRWNSREVRQRSVGWTVHITRGVSTSLPGRVMGGASRTVLSRINT